jgi:hypothetical protein
MSGAIPMTLLARQLALLGDRFKTRYPHPWLVWEPNGSVRAADANEADAASTHVPKGGARSRPAGSDALCFPVGPEKQVRVGRATSNDIVVDDMTMSREQFLLFLEGNTWYLALAEPVTCATFVRRMSVQPKTPVFLVDGCTISAGDVELTFYEGVSIVDRLQSELKRQGA